MPHTICLLFYQVILAILMMLICGFQLRFLLEKNVKYPFILFLLTCINIKFNTSSVFQNPQIESYAAMSTCAHYPVIS